MIRNVIGQLHLNRVQTAVRFVSNAHQKLIRNHNDLKFLPKEEMSPFMSYLPKIIEDASHKDAILDYPCVTKRLEKLLKYYGPSGKFLRIHIIIYVYKMIEQHFGTFDPKNIEQLYKLCWCVEMLNIQFMIVDDLLDNHEIRRGKKAWYKQDNVGLSVVMDSYLLQNSIFHLLKKYFSRHPNYTNLIENFLKLDLASALTLEIETKDLNDFSYQRVNEIAQSKTTYFSFVQPFHLTTLLADKCININDMAKKVFEYLGYLYTVQNDMLDCYGEDFGAKPGTDIQEKRCTLPIVIALDKACPQQRKILEECYGTKNELKIKKVKQLYQELDVLGEYYKLEKTVHDKISEEMENIPDDFGRSLIEKLVHVYTFGEIGRPHV